ncbi:MAG: hypothetical protein MAG451_02448 [Anaerolineales bacterium]|nr:hypothetical protein [Anaerolineales bacterium]
MISRSHPVCYNTITRVLQNSPISQIQPIFD